MENPQIGQLILVNRKDTTRLLEVYVKRSLSLNDGKALDESQGKSKPRKWVTLPERHKKLRRHSSDPLFDLPSGFNVGRVGVFTAVETPNQPEAASSDSEKKSKKTKKKKRQKPTFWKSFLGLFSRKESEEKEEEQESRKEMDDVSPPQDDCNTSAACLPQTGNHDAPKRRKSLRRRFSKRRLSLRKPSKQSLLKENVTGVESVVSVEPTYAYYEKVSEELEKIVHEVKEKEEQLADEEVIARIIALTKQQGDAIDEKLKGNSMLCNFFQRISYNSFQELLDTYLQMTQTETTQTTVPPTAPELVKLAFTLDFTARVAGLNRKNVGHITGLGTRYLENKFAYQQACTDHPWSDNDD